MNRWTRRARSLGSAFLEVLQAELEALLSEIQTTGRGWLRALIYFASAAAFVFWSVGVFTAFVIALLAELWGVWRAAAAVLLLLILVAGGLIFAGYRVLRQHRPPTAIVRGHLEDHLHWWRNSLAEREATGHRLGKKARRQRPADSEEPPPEPEETR